MFNTYGQLSEFIEIITSTTYKEAIQELANNENFLHASGPHKGKYNITKIANKIECDRNLVRFHLDIDNAREKVNNNAKKRYTTINPKQQKKLIKQCQNDPDSIFNEESLGMVLNDKNLEIMFKD